MPTDDPLTEDGPSALAAGAASAGDLAAGGTSELRAVPVATPPATPAPPAAPTAASAPTPATTIPEYLEETYHWAYLAPGAVRFFDRPFIVSAILWGNYRRLMRAAVEEFEPGWSVLQTACVYGNLSPKLADRLGPDGALEIIDVAPIQIANCRAKLGARTNARLALANAGDLGDRGPYDAICCFFLLHEVPEDMKSAIVNGLLERVKPGGRIVFVDYHRPALLHPLRPLMRLVFHYLEPFAIPLWRREILSYAAPRRDLRVRKSTFFGGLYQKVVVDRTD